MANLYYNAAVDTAWNTLGNWWNDSNCFDPALALPATGDTVYLAAGMTSGPSTSVTLFHIYVWDYFASGGFSVDFSGAIGDATFEESLSNSGTITGNATFQAFTVNTISGTVAGNATFNSVTVNNGTVNGNATFNDSSYNLGTISGDATFNDSSNNAVFLDFGPIVIVGTISGDATFNDSSYNHAYYNPQLDFANGAAVVGGDAVFNNSSVNYGLVQGNGTFNNSSCNARQDFLDNPITMFGTIQLNATFNDDSYSRGLIGGDATFNDDSYYAGATIGGNATFSASNALLTIKNLGVSGSVSIVGSSSGKKAISISQLLKLPFPINI
jgi:hypothetical protein